MDYKYPTFARTYFKETKVKRPVRWNYLYRNNYPTGLPPARFYGLPKLHKKREPRAPPPLRPIVSFIGAYNYNLCKYQAYILGPCIPGKHTTQHSFSFVNEFTNIQSQNKFLISFDVESLFTNIKLSETIDLQSRTKVSRHLNRTNAFFRRPSVI